MVSVLLFGFENNVRTKYGIKMSVDALTLRRIGS